MTDIDRRLTFIQSLRECADFLEAHPAIPVPQNVQLMTFLYTRAEMVALARVTSWQKVYSGDWFRLKKQFGDDLSLEIVTDRETVCRKVVKGSHLQPAQPERMVDDVEWVCDEPSLLAVK